MIKGIINIKMFGVFENYSKPAIIEEFAQKNIIYGWNYSGKTTVSRIFHSIDTGIINPEYSDATFQLDYDGNNVVSETTLTAFPCPVKVFNSDFIESNLNWDGTSFAPILLLGNESIEAQKSIETNKQVIARCRLGYADKKKSAEEVDTTIRDAKTTKASHIKTTLALVESFTATHLNQILPTVETDPAQFIQNSNDYATLLKKALANESDKLPIIDTYSISGHITQATLGISDILQKTPELTNTLDYLAENPEVSDWVKTGIGLHEGKDNCDFCGNKIEFDRLTLIKSHFSKDLQDHEDAIKGQINKLEGLLITLNPIHIRDFYSALQADVIIKQKALDEAIVDHNNQIQILITALSTKLDSQHSPVAMPEIDNSSDENLNLAINAFNDLINNNNAITINFDESKTIAIETLKLHFVAEFVIEVKLAKLKWLFTLFEKYTNKYESIANTIMELNLELEATISDAQKGREELNKYIEKFLGDSNIKIDVITDGDNDRFVLLRGEDKARNLSEGEKTSIAFSFFLVKLHELQNLNEAIVYIDDPISSLDSNHLFQVNAVIKDFFFWQDEANNHEWKLTVKQIFFSTHNFEFLSLLKELPMGKPAKTKYYLIKRISVEQSVFIDLPESIKKYSSEYHYLWHLIHSFHVSEVKDDIEILLGLPNAMRRFIELYTYSKIPSPKHVTVDQRADILFGPEKSLRIMKVLHHFSHLNNMTRMAQNSELMSDIENVVSELVENIKKDALHYDALMESI